MSIVLAQWADGDDHAQRASNLMGSHGWRVGTEQDELDWVGCVALS